MESTPIQNPLEIDPEFNVEEWTSNNRYKSHHWWSKSRPKTIARVMDFGEGRDSGVGVEGGEISPTVGKDRLRTGRVFKLPEPRRLVGFPSV